MLNRFWLTMLPDSLNVNIPIPTIPILFFTSRCHQRLAVRIVFP